MEPRLRQVVLKRAMYRAGTLLAEELGADALVTGESLGQVSTQTLRNLAVAEEAAGVPLIRPLIGMDKEEIIARARRIGTHDASERVREHCHISTGRVETAARLRDVVTAEHRVDEAFVAGAVRDRRTVGVRSWRPGPPPAHVAAEVPEGAVVVDVREPEEGVTVGDVRLPSAGRRSGRRGWTPPGDTSSCARAVAARRCWPTSFAAGDRSLQPGRRDGWVGSIRGVTAVVGPGARGVVVATPDPEAAWRDRVWLRRAASRRPPRRTSASGSSGRPPGWG